MIVKSQHWNFHQNTFNHLPICVDIDECGEKNELCTDKLNTECVNTIGSFDCNCVSGFEEKEITFTTKKNVTKTVVPRDNQKTKKKSKKKSENKIDILPEIKTLHLTSFSDFNF